MLSYLKSSLIASAWFVFLTFPIMVVRVNTLKQTVEWRWLNLLWVALGAFVLSALWRWAMQRRERGGRAAAATGVDEASRPGFGQRLLEEPKIYRPLLSACGVAALVFPLLLDSYQVKIMVLALIYVVLGLGLNITVGLAGLLDLGYIAFFAVGAYTYGILNTPELNQHIFGTPIDLGFWLSLPIGGLVGALFGILLGFPILRLRGDYLAIVTLGFGLITKICIENWEGLTNGVQGITGIDRPGLFGIDMSINAASHYIYYLMLLMVLFAIFITNRLKDSRIGRAWIALREDEIACVAMGVDMAWTKLSAYAFGAFWAGLVGVLFAARNSFINPDSFTFMESAMVLSIVVLGGMGSIVGVIIAALVLILMPEYLRAVADYRWLVFGAVMVLMMIFRPQGLIANVRKSYAVRRGPKTEAP